MTRAATDPIISFTYEDDDGYEVETSLPATWEACHRCRGNGTHVNPAIDGNGLTREDFDEDPDFEEGYFSGRYDVACYECDGRRVVPEVDEGRCDPALLARYYAHLRDEADYQAEVAAERRMGA